MGQDRAGAMRSIRPRPLDRAAFGPFGDVVEADGAGMPANDGRARRFAGLATFAATAPSPELSIYRVEPSALPLTVDYMERHPNTTQLFFPTEGKDYLVVVAPSGALGEPDPAGVAAFVGRPGQGINYRAGTWHYPIVALQAPAAFLMLMWETGTTDDCQTARLAIPVRIEAPAI